MSALENVREEVAKHERLVSSHNEVIKKTNLTEIIGGVFGRIADVQKQYEKVSDLHEVEIT